MFKTISRTSNRVSRPVPNNQTLPRVPLAVREIVGDLSRCQILSIVNPMWISRERPSRLRAGLKVQGRLVMTPSEGADGSSVPGQSRRTPFGDTIAKAIAPHLPAEYTDHP